MTSTASPSGGPRPSSSSSSITDDYETVLRPLRLILSATVAGLVLLDAATGATAAEADVLAIALVLAVANVAWGLGPLSRGRLGNRSTVADTIQAIFDTVLALAAVAIIDGNASPLVWLLLMLPVVGVAARHGMVGALFTWLGVSIAYLLLLLNLPSSASLQAEVLRLGVEQAMAVVAVAVPTVILGARVRQTLDGTRAALQLADRTRSELRLTSRAAQRMGAATTPDDVLDVALESVLALGFDRVDVSDLVGDRWRLMAVAGNAGEVPADAIGLLARAAGEHRSGADGAVESNAEDRQALHDFGYERAAAFVVSNETIVLGLRVFVDERSLTDPDGVEAVQTLVEHLLGALGNTMTTAHLTAWASELQHRANHDELTGLPNRANLLAVLVDNADVDAAVLFLDLNGFKQVNDDHGHEAGDAVLRVVAKRLQSIVGDEGLAARLGGDEFVIFSTGRDRTGLASLAERVAATIAEPIVFSGRTFNVGASIGIAEAAPGSSGTDLLRGADQAMYEAKTAAHRTGTSQHRFLEPSAGELS